MTYTEKRLEELDERLKEFAPTNTEQDIYLLAEDFKSFLTTSIQQAEKSGKDQMREELGCICKNLAPASVHFKDCPLGKCHQALAEERTRVVEAMMMKGIEAKMTPFQTTVNQYLRNRAKEIGIDLSFLDKLKEI